MKEISLLTFKNLVLRICNSSQMVTTSFPIYIAPIQAVLFFFCFFCFFFHQMPGHLLNFCSMPCQTCDNLERTACFSVPNSGRSIHKASTKFPRSQDPVFHETQFIKQLPISDGCELLSMTGDSDSYNLSTTVSSVLTSF